jgi:hypothetical protein
MRKMGGEHNTNSALEGLYKALNEEAEGAENDGGVEDGEEDLTKGFDGDEDAEDGDAEDFEKGFEPDFEKAEGGDDEDEESDADGDEDAEDGEDADAEGDDEDDDVEKSFSDYFDADGDEDLQKSIDASSVLSRLTEATASAFDGLQETLNKSLEQQDNVNEALVTGLTSTIHLLKSIGNQVETLSAEVARMGSTPTARRSAAASTPTLKKSVANTQPPSEMEGLTHQELQEKLVKGAQKGLVGVDTISAFDRTGSVPAAVFAKVKDL